MSAATGAWGNNSDIRMKKNIKNLNNYLSIIKKLRPVFYQWKTQDETDEKTYAGFIAQEVEELIPDAVCETYNEQLGYVVKGIMITNLIPFIVKAIQEQQHIIDSLKTENKLLQDQITNILSRVSALESK